jgi:hypothetical protein
MKLTSAQVKQTLEQFDAEAIPEDHPAAAQLSQAFGDHTFFLDLNGLHIVAPVEPPSGNSHAGKRGGQVVKLASWNDSKRTSLAPHEPEATEFYIVMAA